MLVWLASYPRSGNTYVRIVLNRVFGIGTYTLAGEGDQRVFSSRPGVIELVGHQLSSLKGDDLIQQAHTSDQPYVIKTHEPPLTDDPTIYIVRDGRSAVASYYHYRNDIGQAPVDLESIIAGRIYAG